MKRTNSASAPENALTIFNNKSEIPSELRNLEIIPVALDTIDRVEADVVVRILNLFEKFPGADIPQNIVKFTKSTNDAIRLALAKALSANPNEISFGALKDLLDEIGRASCRERV